MKNAEIMDVVFRHAVDAIDAGDIGALTKLVKENPRVLQISISSIQTWDMVKRTMVII